MGFRVWGVFFPKGTTARQHDSTASGAALVVATEQPPDTTPMALLKAWMVGMCVLLVQLVAHVGVQAVTSSSEEPRT